MVHHACQNKPLPIFPSPQPSRKDPASEVNHEDIWLMALGHFFGAFSPTCYQYSRVIYHILRYWLYLWWGIIIDHHRSSWMNGSIYQPLTARNAIQPTNLRASGICLSCDAHQWISFKTILTGKPPIFPCHGKIPGFQFRFSPKPTGNPWVPDTMTSSFIGSCWP